MNGYDRWNLPHEEDGWGLCDSYTLTPSSTPQPILPHYYDGKVSWLGLRMRTMGNATYVALGGESSQEFRFGVEAKDYFELGRSNGRHVNPKHTYISSDGTTAVVEVIVVW